MQSIGLFQRLTVTIGFAWLTRLAVYMLKAPFRGSTWPSKTGYTPARGG